MKLKPLMLALSLSMGSLVAQAASTVVYCSPASPEGFDTAQYTGGDTFDAASMAIFNRLVDFKNGTTEIIPSLAESWTVSPDGLAYTFKLRKGVKFQTTEYFKPSRDFNATDVVFSYQRMLDPKHPYNKAYPAEFPYVADTGLDSNISSLSATDPYTVVFVLKKPDDDLLPKMAIPALAIQSAEYADKLIAEGHPAQINQQPVGTGPFVLKRYQKDSQIRYAKFAQYWDAKNVFIDNLIFAITTDASVRAQKLKAGECQIMAYPKTQDVAGLKADPKLKVNTSPGFNIGYLAYNMQRPITGKLEVRQALDMAINRKAILEAVYQGQGQEAANPMPPSLWGYNTKLKNATFDLTKAKELLKTAGYPDGFEITLWAMPVQRPYNPNARLMAEMIQADWAKIGVRAKITNVEWGEYLKRMKAGESDTGLIGWTGDYASPDNFIGVLLTCDAIGGNNFARYCNKTEFDAPVLKARNTINRKERIDLYMKAQEVFKHDLPWSTIAHSTVNQPMVKGLNGFKNSPFGVFNFVGVSLK